MKFLLLIYTDPKSREAWGAFSQAEQAEGLRAYAALNQDLTASGEFIAAESLADSSFAKRVAVRGRKTVTTDGPFAESKELMAGFYLVECGTLERAIEVASRIPEAAIGLVEVRPVMTFTGMES